MFECRRARHRAHVSHPADRVRFDTAWPVPVSLSCLSDEIDHAVTLLQVTLFKLQTPFTKKTLPASNNLLQCERLDFEYEHVGIFPRRELAFISEPQHCRSVLRHECQ